ncbi:hypothetical protein MTR67_011948 [Solanum verrucosum]|uniref:Integrase catalytic domain-containing protein n=1 Tax=Solanum verrucosum TaxID=315347 RepID=A0AAF0TJT9_SOLVR|nr:hypothetical protein MTR67_011948 [Solanum verrucosum]
MNVLYRMGKANFMVDALSRLSMGSETNGQAERTIKILEEMLKAYMIYFKGSSDDQLHLIEYAYNNNFHYSVQMAPYETLYGCKCESPVGWFEVGEAGIIMPDLVYEAVEKFQLIIDRLNTTQSHQKSYADLKIRD